MHLSFSFLRVRADFSSTWPPCPGPPTPASARSPTRGGFTSAPSTRSPTPTSTSTRPKSETRKGRLSVRVVAVSQPAGMSIVFVVLLGVPCSECYLARPAVSACECFGREFVRQRCLTSNVHIFFCFALWPFAGSHRNLGGFIFIPSREAFKLQPTCASKKLPSLVGPSSVRRV